MVQLQEIVDEHFQGGQPGPEEDDADFTDTDSEISEESEYDPSDETLGERLYALRDIIPPHTRGYITSTVSTASDVVKSVLSFSGKTLWVISSSALLLGIPWALAWAEEQQVLEMEKEMKMREMGGDLLTAGAGGPDATAASQQIIGALSSETKPAYKRALTESKHVTNAPSLRMTPFEKKHSRPLRPVPSHHSLT